jgi:predicted MFS family arabinose efflux permease
VIRRIFGDEIDPALRTVLATVVLGVVGQYAFFSFFAIWALDELQAPQTQVGLAFTASALAAVAGAILGGRMSDRVGRRPLIVTATVAQTLAPMLLLVPGLGRWPAFCVLVVMGFIQPVRGTSQRALIADLAAERERERAYGAFRVAFNVGATTGPLMGAALVALDWDALHVGVSAAYALSLLPALRLPKAAPVGADGGPMIALRSLFRNRVFLLAFLASILAFGVYNAYEVLMPVSLTQSHGFSAAEWGVVSVANPLLVIVFQMRLTRWTGRLGLGPKLGLAVPLMGLPFLILTLTAAVPVVLIVIAVFVVGEMLWAPASEALVVNMAPPGLRGAYLGAATAGSWAGSSLTPVAGLQTRAALGDDAMWLLVAAASVAGGLLYLRAVTSRHSRREPRAALAAD